MPENTDTEHLLTTWHTVLANLLNNPTITAQQKGFLQLAVPKAMVGDNLVDRKSVV